MYYFKSANALYINTYVFVDVIFLDFIFHLDYHSTIVRE